MGNYNKGTKRNNTPELETSHNSRITPIPDSYHYQPRNGLPNTLSIVICPVLVTTEEHCSYFRIQLINLKVTYWEVHSLSHYR